ncbi:MAG TPA: DUF362 domain-containing protein [Pyrinomonadaceae bacterium]|jgi:uncharacterized protein (DUF362 family)|nr:DUF362 domain-containing protein [Pyrinomonadaceae bacterium]
MFAMLDVPTVSVYRDPLLVYPERPPFNADREYPEYTFAGKGCLDPTNRVYGAVRESLRLLGLDSARFGSPQWNPLGSIVKPGNSVMIKPNAVLDINQKRGETVFASITHGSVLRAVVDYVYRALDGRGQIIIADAPLAHSDFENWKKITGVQAVVELYREQLGFEIQVHDLRNLYVPWDYENTFAPSHLRDRTVRDPAGYVEVDLGASSEYADFSERDIRLMFGSDFKREETVRHHLDGHHRYYVAKSVLDADVLISVPKLKTHQKVGATLNIKGMVGTQGDKNYIPHFRIGHPSRGGDEYPDLGILQNSLNRARVWLYTSLLGRETRAADLAFKLLRRVHHTGQRAVEWRAIRKYGAAYKGNITGGAWYGNDTAWRMALDLIRIALYADSGGNLCRTPQRNFFSVIDGVVGGEAEGPLAPTAKPSGAIVAGTNPLMVDAVAVRLMGYAVGKIRMVAEGFRKSWLNPGAVEVDEIAVASNVPGYRSMMKDESDALLDFQPSKGWRNHIEIASSPENKERPPVVSSRPLFQPEGARRGSTGARALRDAASTARHE